MTITFGMMLNQMAGLFVLLVTGFLLNRLHILPKETETVLSRVAAKLLLPAFMIYTFMEECTVANLMEHGNLVIYGGVFQVTGIFAAILLAKWLGKGDPFLSGVYRYALGFPNIGGFGFPTMLALFGQFGLFQYQLFMLVNHFLCYAWGVGQMRPMEERGDWRELLKRTYIIALLRLILIPGAFLVVLRILHVPDMICVLTCLAFACPCGMNTVVFPAAYGQDTRPGAGLTLLTSAAAVVTIPLMMSIMM